MKKRMYKIMALAMTAAMVVPMAALHLQLTTKKLLTGISR